MDNDSGIATISATPQEDAARLKPLLKKCSMTQADFAETYGIGSQAMLWQFLNPENKKGRPLNIVAAAGFASGLGCRIGDFSPSLQLAVDKLSAFASGKIPNFAEQERASYVDGGAKNAEELQLLQGFRAASIERREDMLSIAAAALKTERDAA